METLLSIRHGFFSFLVKFLVFVFWLLALDKTLDPNSPSVPSTTLRLTHMHMYTARVSTQPGGQRGNVFTLSLECEWPLVCFTA